jgi:Flp pilus assembly protein TadG
MAIIFPLMFLVLAGIVDFGRAFFYQIQLTNAAREGARTAVVSDPADNPADTLLAVQTRASSSAPNVPALLTTLDTACAGDPLDVATVTSSTVMEWYLLKPAMNIIQMGSVLPPKLESTAVMQCGG